MGPEPNQDRWENVRALFHQAVDLPADQRPAFLTSIGDPDLRGEVEQLLAAASRLDSGFLAGSALAAPAALTRQLMAEQEPALGGTVLKGRYRIERFLARGGQGMVWLATDLHQQQERVAIKVLRVAEDHAQWLRKRFAAEWTALSALRHVNVVGVRDFGDIEGLPFLVMEYVEGETLRGQLASRLPAQSVAAIVRQLGEALGAAHRLGICHRDLKPENVLVTAEGSVKLIDFGIAQMERTESGGTVTILMMAGTARYMAPEQFLGIASPRSDIYSLGVVVYEMLAGKCPYAADDALEIARAQRHRPMRAILGETSEIPKRLVGPLAAALSMDPDQRPADAEAFASEVAAIILEPKLTWKRRLERAARWILRTIPARAAVGTAVLAAAGWWTFAAWQEAHVEAVVGTANAHEPETDGFLPHVQVMGTVLFNEAATGFEAWMVSSGSQGHYHRRLSTAQKKVALRNGWTLTMMAKPIEGRAFALVDFVGWGPMYVMEVAPVQRNLLVSACRSLVPAYDFIDAEVALDPAVYREYRMSYDPVSKTAQIAVDGKVVITGYRGTSQYQDDLGVDFGCERFRSAASRAAFKSVRFEIHAPNRGSS